MDINLKNWNTQNIIHTSNEVQEERRGGPWFKINASKSVAFIYSKDKQTEKEIREMEVAREHHTK